MVQQLQQLARPSLWSLIMVLTYTMPGGPSTCSPLARQQTEGIGEVIQGCQLDSRESEIWGQLQAL